MDQLHPEEVEAFMDRWGDFHDAVIQTVDFDLPAARVTLTMQAQDKSADWAWRGVRIVVEGLSEFSFRQPTRHDLRVIFEAGASWDGSTVLFALGAPSEADADAIRGADAYFGGRRLEWTSWTP